MPLRLVEVAGVDAGPGRAGGVLGGQCVQGPEEAFAGVALLQFQNAVVPLDGCLLQLRMPALTVVGFDWCVHPGGGVGHIGHIHMYVQPIRPV
ncbi:hypothetical protein [Streptomyces mirabilis]|uniref:hypothetical protein n=1 Tax=Streptomyces mirabilis TaxID=68239 RepID=UPI00225B4C35|nr:hypothetical protein [Streptomyces mirabilis]MCX4608918.1 hypothetical protein [Streptomyces mirabilis]